MNKQNSKIWIENIESGKDTYREKYLSPKIRKHVKRISDGRKILDVGCGTGCSVAPYLKPNQIYFGIDPSPKLLNHFVQDYGFQFYQPQGLRLMGVYQSLEDKAVSKGSFPENVNEIGMAPYDELLCSMVSHYSPDIRTFFDSVFRLTSPRAGYFISTFDSEARPEIESFFRKISDRNSLSTTGDYVLPNNGILKNVTLNFHDNNLTCKELSKRSRFIHTESVGKIFRIYEGIKN
jgi:2-polyprenyl-3-methyl-5-hydroxy-6-metoxy-1,4-benzoquinol methylase